MSPVAPERKKRTVYARAALERMQLAHRLHEVLHLRQDEVLEVRRVSHERICRSDAFHRGVEPGEAGVADPSRDLRAVAPGERVFVSHEHLVGLLDRRRYGVPINGREAPEADHLHAQAVLVLQLLRRHQRALYDRAVRHNREIAPFARESGLAERDHEVGPGVRQGQTRARRDRKSTRLNSSHLVISYAVFCLKKKKNTYTY